MFARPSDGSPQKRKKLTPMNPSKLAVSIDNLSFFEVDKLHKQSVEGLPHFQLNTSIDRLRLTLRDTSQLNNNNKRHSLPAVSKVSPRISNRKYIHAKYPLTYAGPIFNPTTVLNELFYKQKLDQYLPISLINTKRLLQHSSLEFVLLLLDVNMQVIGTFDPSMNDIPKGIVIGPSYLNDGLINEADLNENQANVIEFRLNEINSNVFAIVPIFLHEHVSKNDVARVLTLPKKSYEYDVFIEYQAKSPFDLNSVSQPKFLQSPSHKSSYDLSLIIDDLNHDIRSVLNEPLKITEVDQFGVERKYMPDQDAIKAKVDGVSQRFNLLNAGLLNDETDSSRDSNDFPNLNQMEVKIIGKIHKNFNTMKSTHINDTITSPRKDSVTQHSHDDLKWMEKTWCLDDPLDASVKHSSYSNSKVDNNVENSSKKMFPCQLWGFLHSSKFNKYNSKMKMKDTFDQEDDIEIPVC